MSIVNLSDRPMYVRDPSPLAPPGKLQTISPGWRMTATGAVFEMSLPEVELWQAKAASEDPQAAGPS